MRGYRLALLLASAALAQRLIELGDETMAPTQTAEPSATPTTGLPSTPPSPAPSATPAPTRNESTPTPAPSAAPSAAPTPAPTSFVPDASYADLALFLQLWELLEEDNWPEALTKLQLPQLDQFVKGLAARPKIAAYLANSRMPRNGPFDGTSYPFKPGRTALPDAGKKQEL